MAYSDGFEYKVRDLGRGWDTGISPNPLVAKRTYTLRSRA
jgi:hypothetical protein